jgi:hypothetical protein
MKTSTVNVTAAINGSKNCCRQIEEIDCDSTVGLWEVSLEGERKQP